VIYTFAEFEFDDERLELRCQGRVVKTEAVALRLLAALVERAGEVVSKDELIDDVWEGRAVADNVITVAMARLRKALNSGPEPREFVLTVYGRGYRFVGPFGTREAPDGLPHASAQQEGPPFVGRERIIERLEHALADAQRGRGRLCVLMGEAGIGKTRAVEALQQKLVGRPVRVAWGFCREVGDTPPLWPWLRLLREVAAGSRSPELTHALSELSDVLRPLSLAPNEQGRDATALPHATRHRSFDLFSEAFARAAEEVAWVLVLDDLHRADAASLELLSYLIDEIAQRRILIVATLRNGSQGRPPRPDTHLPYVLGHRNCERIVLDRLREPDVALYVAAVLDDGDGRLARAVFTKSEGNPFYMTELARQLADVESPIPEQLMVPDVALELIRQRMERLSPEARQVLAAAAVIGRSFELSLLHMVTGRSPNELMTSLDEAIAADLVVAAPESTTAFAFGHDLMRAVLYEGLSSSEQRRRHVLTAEALEQRLAQGDAVPSSELAYHLHAGLPDSDLRKTVAYCRAASVAAASVYAHSDVIRYLQHALEALGLMERPSVRLRMSLWYVVALYSQGQPSSVRALEEVVRLASERGGADMLARASIMLNPFPGMRPMAGARAAFEQALKGLNQDELALRAVVHAGLAITAPDSFDRARSEALADQALELARRSGSRAARYCAGVIAMYVYGGPDGRARADRAAHDVAELHGPTPTIRMAVAPLYVALYRAVAALSTRDHEALHVALEAGLHHGRAIRHFLSWHFRRGQLLLELNSGGSTAQAALGVLHRAAEQERFVWAEPYCTFDRIVVFREYDEGAPTLTASERATVAYDGADPPSIWSLKVRVLAAAGLYDEARASLRSVGPDRIASLPCDSQLLGTLAHLTHAALELREGNYLEPLERRLAPYAGLYSADYAFWSEPIAQLLASICAARGEHAQAAGHAEAALVASERAGYVVRACEARVALAAALFAKGSARDEEHATVTAREAQRSASRLGLRSIARRAALLLKGRAKP
jgi:DNA-binding winged helix-turn-helix (wHTH) protein